MNLAFVLLASSVSVAVLCGILAGISDFRRMRIPNALSLLIAVTFALAFFADAILGESRAFAPLLSHFFAGCGIFFATYVLFLFRVFGAGDSKLLTAYGFWVGLQGLPVFLFWVTMIGALLALVAICVGRMGRFPAMPEGSWLARVRSREAVVPYGIAIGSGAVAAFAFLGYFDFAALSQGRS